MEHRWGRRYDVDLPVHLKAASPGALDTGCIINISLSGALIQTDLRLDPLTRVEVRFGLEWISGYVIRCGSSLVAVEWCHFAPREIAERLPADRLAMPKVEREEPGMHLAAMR